MSDTIKITKRDNYNYLRQMVLDYVPETNTQDRLLTFIDHELELMTKRAAKSKAYQTEHRAVNDPMTEKIMDVLMAAETPMCATDIAPKIEDATPRKVVYRLGQLFKTGVVAKDVQNIQAEDGTKHRVTYYTATPAVQVAE